MRCDKHLNGDPRPLLTSVDDLVPLEVADAIKDSSTYFTWMDVPV